MNRKCVVNRAVCALSAIALSATALCASFVGCKREEEVTPLSFLTAHEGKVVNEEGQEVILRGVNAGGLCVIEPWMNGFANSWADDSDIYCHDHKTITLEFIERFGEDGAKELWDEYQKNWWSEQDFKNCAEMGMNVIRLPFTYMNVDFGAVVDFERAGEYDFSYLDWFVKTAEKYGLYTILDLHGAYGSQNGRDHSGEDLPVGGIDFYSNEQKIELTADLWRAVADHFSDNSAVAGYDLLNEPGEKKSSDNSVFSTEKRHWDALDKFYKAVREVDTEHITIFESCWEAANLPQPKQYGWVNCMYSFHHYTDSGLSAEAHEKSFIDKLNSIEKANFGVPLYMGEFTCYESADKWEKTLALMNDRNWHWTSWTYKLNATYKSAWGILNVVAKRDELVNAHNDAYEIIIAKFQNLKTTEDTYRSQVDDTTVWDIFKNYCAKVEQE